VTTFLLIRHGLTDSVDRSLAGTAPGVPLNSTGRRQARAAAERLADVPLSAVISSPVQRALETAEPIAAAHRLRVEEHPSFGEMEFGAWTGASFSELDGREGWRQFNDVRSLARAPGGELMLSVQNRAVDALLALQGRYSAGCVAVVSHGDVIRALLMFCLGTPIDFVHRLEVSPGRVSVITLQPGSPPIVRQVNGDTVPQLS
jgi:broad specificity phosphatase PhoE